MAIATGTAILAGTALAATGGIAGAALGADAQGDAQQSQAALTREGIAAQERINQKGIDAQKEMADKSIAFLEKQFGIARDDLEPFRQSQLKAVTDLQGLADPTNPLYQAQRQQATEAIQRQLSAQGLLRSGMQGKMLTNLELGLMQNRASVLGQLSGTGAGAQSSALAQNLGSAGSSVYSGLGQGIGAAYGNLGSNVGSSLLQLGQGIGASKAAQGQLWGGAAQGAFNAVGAGLGSYANYDMQRTLLNRLFPAG